MLCLAAFCGVMMSLLQCVATKYGLGAHAITIQPIEMERFLKVCFDALRLSGISY